MTDSIIVGGTSYTVDIQAAACLSARIWRAEWASVRRVIRIHHVHAVRCRPRNRSPHRQTARCAAGPPSSDDGEPEPPGACAGGAQQVSNSSNRHLSKHTAGGPRPSPKKHKNGGAGQSCRTSQVLEVSKAATATARRETRPGTSVPGHSHELLRRLMSQSRGAQRGPVQNARRCVHASGPQCAGCAAADVYKLKSPPERRNSSGLFSCDARLSEQAPAPTRLIYLGGWDLSTRRRIAGGLVCNELGRDARAC